MAVPILRWAGGKRQILDEIIPRLPPEDKYNDYYEPFFGGGAVFFALEPSNGYINDINSRLMNFYRCFRDHMDEIIEGNQTLDDELYNLNTEKERKEFYYEKREEFNQLRENGKCVDELKEATLFLFLNRTCWNGLYRTNEQGDFNVPMKRKVIYTEAIDKQLRKGYRVLQNTRISSKDFTYLRDEVDESDLVFLDPPYIEVSKTAQFKKYNARGFSDEQQEEVRNVAIELHQRGAYVMITNSYAAKQIYTEHDEFVSNFRVIEVEGTRSINSDSSQRTDLGKTDIIATNIPQFWEQKKFDDFR